MRKTEAGVRARIESNRDGVPVELWSRAPRQNGVPIPRIARTWTLMNPKDFENDQAIQTQRAELEDRGFHFERTVDEATTLEVKIDKAIANAEPAVIRSQFKLAVERLGKILETRLDDQDPQAARALLEKMALIAGDRRRKVIEVAVNRRAS